MTRKQRNWAFWILVISLNMIPLVAQGEGAPAPTAGQRPPARAAGAPKGVNPVKAARDARGVGEGSRPEREGSRLKPEEMKAPQTAPAPEPEAPVAEAPAAPAEEPQPRFTGKPGLLGGAELKLLRGFDGRHDPHAKIENFSAILVGQIPTECVKQGLIEITQVPSVSCVKVDAGAAHAVVGTKPKQASGFEIHDKGGLLACLDHYKPTSDGHNSCGEIGCTPLENLPNAKFDPKNLKENIVMLLRKDPDANSYEGQLCENFSTAITITTQKDREDAIRTQQQEEDSKRLATWRAGVSCVENSSQLKIAYQFCQNLAAMGEYHGSTDECVDENNLDEKAKQIEEGKFTALKAKVSSSSASELDGIAGELSDWARKHPKQCKRAIAPLQAAAKKMVTKKKRRSRDDDEEYDPITAYDDAISMLESARSKAPCLDNNGKIEDIIANLTKNKVLKIGELKGITSPEYQEEFMNLAENTQENVAYACGSWEMDTTCTSAIRDMQSLSTINQMVQSSNVKSAQAKAQLCQMVAQSANGAFMPPQCQSNGGSPYGLGGYNGLGYGMGGNFMPVGSSIYGPNYSMGVGGQLGLGGSPLGFNGIGRF